MSEILWFRRIWRAIWILFAMFQVCIDVLWHLTGVRILPPWQLSSFLFFLEVCGHGERRRNAMSNNSQPGRINKHNKLRYIMRKGRYALESLKGLFPYFLVSNNCPIAMKATLPWSPSISWRAWPLCNALPSAKFKLKITTSSKYVSSLLLDSSWHRSIGDGLPNLIHLELNGYDALNITNESISGLSKLKNLRSLELTM